QDRLDRAADLAITALQRAISSSEQRLDQGNTEWPDGAVVLTFHEHNVEAQPKGRLAYLPVTPTLREPPPSAFSEGEALQFREHDRPAAIQKFRELARASDPAIRAGALVRLARNLKNTGRTPEALKVYEDLSTIDGVAVDAAPAGLVARYARCKIFEDAGQQ